MGRLFCFLLAAMPCYARTYVCGEAGSRGKPPAGELIETLTTASRYIAAESTAGSGAGAGFDLGLPPERVDATGCTSSRTFFFSAGLPEGNYRVTVVLGGRDAAITTVRAEGRRLMLAGIATPAGRLRTESFIVNLRRPEIAGGGEVKRKPRELGALDWDSKLTLEFSGQRPSLRRVRIEPAPGVPTIFLAGDSTVVDQTAEPWAAWGQMLPSFFGPGVGIANHAESGETLRSFESERRFAKIFSVIRPGDLLMMQFAHNDQKPGAGYVSPEMYRELLQKYIALARERGAIPMLVTSMNRRTFDATGRIVDTLAPYPQTMREVARSEHVDLIDLNAMSRTLYEAVGEPNSRSLFVYAAAGSYPGQTEALHDDTHFNSYGAFELARLVVLGLQQDRSPLVRFLRQPKRRFDPAHPDQAQAVALPATPFVDTQKPYER